MNIARIGACVPVLELEEFICERNEAPLFKPLNLTIKPGDIIQIAGPNGAGKTTLLRALCGLFSEWKGRLLWESKAITSPDFDMRDQLLYLGHQTGVKKSLTAAENLQWYFGVHGRNVPLDIDSLLAKVGLQGYADIPCQQMSAGQMRRVALARLYASQAKFWILDEPFTAIDVKGVANLEALIQAHADNGGAVLMTTHQALSIENFSTVHLVPFHEGVQ